MHDHGAGTRGRKRHRDEGSEDEEPRNHLVCLGGVQEGMRMDGSERTPL